MPKKKNELRPVPKNDFEVIALKKGFKIDKNHSGEYSHFETYYAWKGWKMFQDFAINVLKEVVETK